MRLDRMTELLTKLAFFGRKSLFCLSFLCPSAVNRLSGRLRRCPERWTSIDNANLKRNLFEVAFSSGRPERAGHLLDVLMLGSSSLDVFQDSFQVERLGESFAALLGHKFGSRLSAEGRDDVLNVVWFTVWVHRRALPLIFAGRFARGSVAVPTMPRASCCGPGARGTWK